MANIDEVKVMSKQDVEVVASVATALSTAIRTDNADVFKEILDFLEEGALKIPVEETVPILQGFAILAAKLYNQLDERKR